MVTRYAHPTQQHQFDAIKQVQPRKPKPNHEHEQGEKAVRGVVAISTTVPFRVRS